MDLPNPTTFPAGDFDYAETLRAPHVDGGAIEGAGPGAVFADARFHGRHTKLFWWGKRDQPFINITGTRWSVDGLTICGRHWQGRQLSGTPAAQGVLVSNAPGLGAGKHRVGWLHLSDLENGVQFGTAQTDHNCDETSFERLQAHRCDRAFRAVNTQAMGFDVFKYTGQQCDTHFWFQGGGTLRVWSAFIIGGTLLRIPGAWPYDDAARNDPLQNHPAHRPGKNNGTFAFDHVHIDQGGGPETKLFQSDSGTPVNVHFSDVRFSFLQYPDHNARAAIATGPQLLTFTNCKNLQRGMLEGRPDNRTNRPYSHPTFVVQRSTCLFDSIVEILAPDSACWIIGRDNVHPSGRPIADQKTLVVSNAPALTQAGTCWHCGCHGAGVCDNCADLRIIDGR